MASTTLPVPQPQLQPVIVDQHLGPGVYYMFSSRKTRNISILLIIAGIISVIFQYYATTQGAYLGESCAGIWTGSIVLGTGLIGLATNGQKRTYRMITLFKIFAALSVLCATALLIISAISVGYCLDKAEEDYDDMLDDESCKNISLIVSINVVLLFTAIVVICLCVYCIFLCIKALRGEHTPKNTTTFLNASSNQNVLFAAGSPSRTSEPRPYIPYPEASYQDVRPPPYNDSASVNDYSYNGAQMSASTNMHSGIFHNPNSQDPSNHMENIQEKEHYKSTTN